MKAWLSTALLLVSSLAYAAESGDDALAWLQRIANAAHQLNYSGHFIYQHGQKMETSQIVHVRDAQGEHEKIAVLDGSPRQIFRTNDEIYCFNAGDNTVTVDKPRAKKRFPALLPEHAAGLKEFYQVRLGDQHRIAGRDAQEIILEPKDGFRYGHRLWADTKTALLLKATTWSEKDIVDQFAFTQISIGGHIDRSQIKPPLAGKKLVRSTGEGKPAGAALDPGWEVGSVPPGFKRISAMKRVLPGANMPVNHIVYSDGLAAASIFIEPATASTEPGLAHQGAFHVYTRRLGDQQIKVLGEVPAATVTQIAEAVSLRK